MKQLVFSWILLASILFLFSSMIPVSTAYTVGVSAGIWVKYGEIQVNYTSLVVIMPLALIIPPPSPTPDWMNLTVQSVRGANITLQEKGHSSNGRGWSYVFIGNVTSGAGNLTLFVIPANLNKNDIIPVWSILRINDTLTRSYAGASRRVNMVNITQSNAVFRFYWDRPSGLLLEFYLNSTRQWVSYRATETNLPTSSAVFTGSQLLFGIPLMAISAYFQIKRKSNKASILFHHHAR